MALAVIILEKNLRALFDPAAGKRAKATAYPQTGAGAAERWALAVHDQYGALVTPPVLPALGALARAGLVARIANLPPGADLPLVFAQYAAALAQAIAPPFTGLPPTGALSFTAVYAAGWVGENGAAAAALAAALHTYLLTGTALNPATGVTVPWR